MFHCLLPSHR